MTKWIWYSKTRDKLKKKNIKNDVKIAWPKCRKWQTLESRENRAKTKSFRERDRKRMTNEKLEQQMRKYLTKWKKNKRKKNWSFYIFIKKKKTIFIQNKEMEFKQHKVDKYTFYILYKINQRNINPLMKQTRGHSHAHTHAHTHTSLQMRMKPQTQEFNNNNNKTITFWWTRARTANREDFHRRSFSWWTKF